MPRTNVPFTELDFLRNKELLKSYLKSQDRFKDYDFDGSNLSVLLDVLSYNTWMNNYYVHAAFSEMFLDTAQLRENLNSHAKELGYTPRSRSSAMAEVNVQLSVPSTSTPTYINIPRNTKFVGRCNGQSFSFYNDTAVTIYPQNGVYRYDGLKIYEGSIRTEAYTVVETQPKRYIINAENCDIESIKVFVRDNVVATSEINEYTYREDVFGVKTDDKIFYIQPYADNKYEIYFGKDSLGFEPKHGSVVTIEYRITNGEDANGVRIFSSPGPISNYNANVFTAAMSEGGAERESLEDIRFFAPKFAQIQHRAVVEDDYSILLRNEFPEIQAVSVYGGEKADPPMFGRTIVAVDAANFDGVTRSQATKYYNFLKQRCPLAIEPMIVSAEFMYGELVTSVYYNTAFTSKTSADIRTLVNTAIDTYNDDYLNDFGVSVWHSKLSEYINDADTYIISNETRLRAVLEYNPILNSSSYVELKFENPLDYDHQFSYGDIHNPAIRSTSFTYDGATCFIADNGAGILNVYRLSASGSTYVTVKFNIGSVDYETGKVIIKDLKVSAYSGNTIKFYASIRSNDIACPVTKIFTIREEDRTINIVPMRE